MLRSLEDTHHLAEVLAAWLLEGDHIAADGPLGAGKSELCRAVLQSLGVTERIASPTFTLCRQYPLTNGHGEHWDFYRIGSFEELEATGWGERWSPHAPVVLAEWASRFPEAFPGGTLWVTLSPLGDGEERMVTLRLDGGLPLALRTFFLGAVPEVPA